MGHCSQPLPYNAAELTVLQSNGVFTLKRISTVLPTVLPRHPWFWCAHWSFQTPRGWVKASGQTSPHKLRYSPRKIRSEDSIVEDVYSADVAYCQVSHRYKKGVSETKTPQDQVSIHCNNAVNQFFLLPFPHPHPLIPSPPHPLTPSPPYPLTPTPVCNVTKFCLVYLHPSPPLPPPAALSPSSFLTWSTAVLSFGSIMKSPGESLQTTDVWAPLPDIQVSSVQRARSRCNSNMQPELGTTHL